MRACQGVGTVITTATVARRNGEDTIESVDVAGYRKLIDAARDARVANFIYVSARGADESSPSPLMRAKAATEAYLRDSGLGYTILEPDMFMDVWVTEVVERPIRAALPVTLVGEGKRKHAFIAASDVAAFALVAIDRSEALRQTLRLGGPRSISWRDVVGAYGAALGRPVQFNRVSLGTPIPGLNEFMSRMLTAAEAFDSTVAMDDLARMYGVRLTSIEEFARRSIAAWSAATA
jgi:uncharacterized protein YbjT (DUF2867 family)